MTQEALKLALEALTIQSDRVTEIGKQREAITAIKEALREHAMSEVQRLGQEIEQEPVTIWYMRDNHTFKKLSAHVSTALIEIEQEFNEGYTYGMLCSKHKGFSTVHASGEKKRLEFFAECKKTLEEWLPNTTPPQRTWVWLTESDRRLINFEWQDGNGTATEIIDLVEAKLKEKNT